MSLQPTPAQGAGQGAIQESGQGSGQSARALRAASAYASADRADAADESPHDFGAALQQALQGVVSSGREADAQARTALLGTGNITEVVTAIAKAELALQTTMAVRDRVVQAYQDIMRMPI